MDKKHVASGRSQEENGIVKDSERLFVGRKKYLTVRTVL